MSYTSNISLATEQQNDIGWQAMAKGWTTEEWAIIQQEYYKLIGSRKTGKRWLVEIIKKLWLIAWDMWEHRKSYAYKKTWANTAEIVILPYKE
mgnify:CR=1 FL=1|jgi:hypothetical protein